LAAVVSAREAIAFPMTRHCITVGSVAGEFDTVVRLYRYADSGIQFGAAQGGGEHQRDNQPPSG
jgi:hypothetical protein